MIYASPHLPLLYISESHPMAFTFRGQADWSSKTENKHHRSKFM